MAEVPFLNRWIRIGVLAALMAGLLFFIIRYGRDLLEALLPLGIGIILAYVLLPMVDAFDNMKTSRTISIIISFVLSILVILVILLWLIPILINNVKDLTAILPSMFDKALQSIMTFIERNIPRHWQDDILTELDNHFFKLQDQLTQGVYDFIASIPKTISLILDVLLAWMLTFYILKDKEQIVKNIKYFFPKSCREDIICFVRDIHRVVLRFIQGQVLIAIIIAIIETLGLYLIGMPYAPLLGFIGGLSNIIPYFGPYIGAIPALAVALTISPWLALWTSAVFLIVQQIDNIYLSPRIMEGKLGLHPVTTIMAVIIGGKLFGLLGLLFSVPLTAMIKILFKRLYRSVSG